MKRKRIIPIVAAINVVKRVYFKIFLSRNPASLSDVIRVRVETMARKIIGKLISLSILINSLPVTSANPLIKGRFKKPKIPPRRRARIIPKLKILFVFIRKSF